MKRSLLFIAMLACGIGFLPLQAQRYLSEVFTSVTVTQEVEYAKNITVISGSPAPDTLHLNVYEPAGDTMTERPLVIVSHTGSFLPVPINGQCTGNRWDSTLVEVCNKLAMRGFVVAAMEYRMGWNPAGNQDERTGGLLNAAYRGIQDARTAVRFFRNNAANGNTYGIDSNMVVMGGIGTGGYIALGCAYLNSYDEVFMTKFFDFNNNEYYLDTALSGDVEGKWQRALNTSNYPNNSSEIQMAFNMGGAVGDSTWIDAGEAPTVSFHCRKDPFAPYMYGSVIVPTTGDFVVDVSGSHDVQRISNAMGLNDAYVNATYTDPYTTAANMRNDGHDGLYNFATDSVEGSPWDWWNAAVWSQYPHPTQGDFHQAGLATNWNMSATKGRTYVDTIMNYLSPRIVCSLGLPGCVTTSTKDKLESGAVTVFPNPSAGELFVRSDVAGNNISAVEMLDLSGRSVFRQTGLKTMEWRIEKQNLSDGMYFVKVSTRKGVLTKKVVIE